MHRRFTRLSLGGDNAMTIGPDYSGSGMDGWLASGEECSKRKGGSERNDLRGGPKGATRSLWPRRVPSPVCEPATEVNIPVLVAGPYIE
jgi:hypothetical protein